MTYPLVSELARHGLAARAALGRFAAVASTVAAVLVSVGACSSATVAGAAASCDPAQCAPKNECLADGAGVVACRLSCAAHTDCPFNYQCATGAPKSYCVKLAVDIAPKATGQWGTHCLAPDGEAGNKACDGSASFSCFGAGTTDATAYCTRFDCKTDLECAGGYYCGTANTAPNVTTDKRSFGTTRTVCLKRAYCSPCHADLDCPVIDGTPSRCADDDLGTGKYCTTPCKTSSNCRLDAACTLVAYDGTRLCRPRAGVCKGDGSLCSPCHADSDCPKGFCLGGAYSPETFCSIKATASCEANVNNTGKCPTFTGYAGTQIGCQSTNDNPSIPQDQCLGVVNFGTSGDIACYTKH